MLYPSPPQFFLSKFKNFKSIKEAFGFFIVSWSWSSSWILSLFMKQTYLAKVFLLVITSFFIFEKIIRKTAI